MSYVRQIVIVTTLALAAALFLMGNPADAKHGGQIARMKAGVPAAEKRFEWPEQFVGDCAMEAGAYYVMKPDGNGHFHARVRSTDSNDEWKLTILVYDEHNGLLGSVPTVNFLGHETAGTWVKHMDNDKQWYDWDINPGNHKPEFFANAHHLAMQSEC